MFFLAAAVILAFPVDRCCTMQKLNTRLYFICVYFPTLWFYLCLGDTYKCSTTVKKQQLAPSLKAKLFNLNHCPLLAKHLHYSHQTPPLSCHRGLQRLLLFLQSTAQSFSGSIHTFDKWRRCLDKKKKNNAEPLRRPLRVLQSWLYKRTQKLSTATWNSWSWKSHIWWS